MTADVTDAAHDTVHGRQSSPVPAWLTPTLVYIALFVLCAFAAYWAMFSQFAPYDDEGFFDYSLKLFLAGHPLYNSVFSDYGPFYYELFGGLFSVLGHSVTTDEGRLVQLLVWLSASFSLGFSAHRLTGRLALGVTALTTSFLLMVALTNEPMHPAALVCALLSAMAFVAAFGLSRWQRGSLIALGALAAALLFTKINVGGYAIISVAFAAVAAGAPLARSALVRRVVVAVFVLVGPVVMFGELDTGTAQTYALLSVLSTLSLVFVAMPARASGSISADAGKWLRWLMAGFAGATVLIIGVIFILGTSPNAIVHDILVVPTHQANLQYQPAQLNGNVVWWSLAATAVAWTLRQVGRTGLGSQTTVPSLAVGALRLVAGAAILLSLGDQFPFSIAPDAPFALAMPLSWVAALPSSRDRGSSVRRLTRVLVPALAILQSLLAYPVAGSQLRLGPILCVLCGAICLADAEAELVAYAGARGVRKLAQQGLSALFVALAVGTTFQYVVEPFQANRNLYRSSVALTIRGATRLRLAQPTAATFDAISAAIKQRCRTLIGMPGLYSFDIWSGVPSPSPMTGAQPWWKSLTAGEQRTLARITEASPGLCLIRNDTEAATYDAGGPIPQVPLVVWLENNFTPALSVGPYVLEVRRR